MLTPEQLAAREGKFSAEYLRSVFTYEPETGFFRRVKGTAKCAKGAIAGGLQPDGYRRIRVNKTKYHDHILAWVYMTGEWPNAPIDHRNGNRSDNRWENLRIASLSENNANRVGWRKRIGRLKGAYRRRNRWEASIKARGIYQYLGIFDTEQEAHSAYCRAAEKLFGEFSRAS